MGPQDLTLDAALDCFQKSHASAERKRGLQASPGSPRPIADALARPELLPTTIGLWSAAGADESDLDIGIRASRIRLPSQYLGINEACLSELRQEGHAFLRSGDSAEPIRCVELTLGREWSLEHELSRVHRASLTHNPSQLAEDGAP